MMISSIENRCSDEYVISDPMTAAVGCFYVDIRRLDDFAQAMYIYPKLLAH